MKPMTDEHAGVHDIPDGKYRINEVFYSVQGEGALVGTPMVFVRFAHCNLRCRRDNAAGFDCDTDFSGGRLMDYGALCDAIWAAWGARPSAEPDPGWGGKPWVLLTGGEPGLQMDRDLVKNLKLDDFRIAVETNGTIKLPDDIDHICMSPKSAPHTIQLDHCDELKVVLAHGQVPPDLGAKGLSKAFDSTTRYFVSPRFGADGTLNPKDAQWCVDLVKRNPIWRLSLQTHKLIGVR